jgi:hypothetical protein
MLLAKKHECTCGVSKKMKVWIEQSSIDYSDYMHIETKLFKNKEDIFFEVRRKHEQISSMDFQVLAENTYVSVTDVFRAFDVKSNEINFGKYKYSIGFNLGEPFTKETNEDEEYIYSSICPIQIKIYKTYDAPVYRDFDGLVWTRLEQKTEEAFSINAPDLIIEDKYILINLNII